MNLRVGLEHEAEYQARKKEFIVMSLLIHKLIFSSLTTHGTSPNYLLARLLEAIFNNDLPKISGYTGLRWYRCQKGGQKPRRWQCKVKTL